MNGVTVVFNFQFPREILPLSDFSPILVSIRVLEAIFLTKTTTMDTGHHTHNKHIEQVFVFFEPQNAKLSLRQVPIFEQNTLPIHFVR